MARSLLAFVVLALWGPSSWAQITVTAPSGGANAVGPANDYATRVLHDPWDMDAYTDLGWFTLTLGGDASATLANPTVSGGIFTGTPTNNDPSFFLLDSYIPGTAGVTKIGSRFPIDASVHKVLVMRMRLSDVGAHVMQFFWSNNTVFTSEPGGGYRISNGVSAYDGWFIYVVDLANLGTIAGFGPDWGTESVDSLRIDPTAVFPLSEIQVDWARLVEFDTGALQRTVQWTGTQNVDIYLDNDANEGNGTLGQVARGHNGGVAATKSFDLYAGGLEPGDYYIGIRATGGAASLAYSPGFYRVLAQPWLTITSPSPQGSDDDFATTVLGNAWDMDSMADVALEGGNSTLGISSISAVNEAGQSLGSVGVLQGVSAPLTPFGDPRIFFLWATNRIDTDHYRILTFDLNLPGPRDMNAGSGARVVWKIADESVENVSAELVVNHRAGANVMARLSMDMETLPLEESSPSTTGWANGGGPTPGVDSFRLDPHEFPTATTYNFQNVKLASLDRSAASFTIKWAYANPSGLATSLSLFADTDTQGCNGLTVATGLNPAAGSYTWSLPAGFADGEERYICAQVSYSASVVGEAYSRFPLLRDLTFIDPTGEIFSDGFESGDTSAW